MEVKVWVEGLPKTICGIHKDTTCHDIIKALAYATKKRGRFVLVERWGQTEKTLSPADLLMHLLQQKGEYWHAVQFILRRTDAGGGGAAVPVASSPGTTASSSANTSESLSPLPRPPPAAVVPLPPDSATPFQRNGMRKSLTSHGSEVLSVPKVVRSRGNVLTENQNRNHALIRENNFPSDLIDVPLIVNGGAEKKSKENGGASLKASPLLVPIIPYGSEVSLQTEEAMRREAATAAAAASHGRQRSMDDQLYRATYGLTKEKGGGGGGGGGAERVAEAKLRERKKQLCLEIKQQKEQLAHTQVDEMHFDRELMLWEEKAEKMAREVESFEASFHGLRSSEKSVIQALKDHSALHLEDVLRASRKTEESLKSEISTIRQRVTECQEKISRAESKARSIAEQLRSDRDNSAEIILKEERDRLGRELQHLAVIQDNQTRRLEEIGLSEQRLESILLAKQLELDSLQGSLKKANFEGFVGTLSGKPDETSPDSLPDPEMDRASSRPVETTGPIRPEIQSPSPAIPARCGGTTGSNPSQRILVLKRNSTREPSCGMWV
ncbi:hypothetical protein BV898_13508 [Hypsibius exemplaris]|uniref:Ras-associating domain-containing protein n=1 Tax=Hypsibius exemplaris TaxID=2072580 RepID=A0A1W0WAJ4_HYPEX|nr:hypothetical protein BV898_13508 [Hypsibius exemplaris]